MPHQCVKCNTIYPDADVTLQGCNCGARAFFFLKNQEKLETTGDIPQEVRDRMLACGAVVLDLETIRITQGKYDLDINALFGKRELIYSYEEGKYNIDIRESFRRHLEK